MIDKPLVAAVLDIDFDWHGIDKNTLSYGWEKYNPIKSMNTYEFANRCKEWALKNGFVLSSYKPFEDDNEPIHWICEWYSNESKVCFECRTHEYSWKEASSEPEAIFEACQYILDHYINKDPK